MPDAASDPDPHQNRLMGRFPRNRFSVLALASDLEPSVGSHLRHSLLDLPRPDQCDAPPPKPLLSEPHQLLERFIAGLAK